MDSGYPSKFSDKCIICEFFNKKFNLNTRNLTNEVRPATFLLFKLLYLGLIAHHIEKELLQYDTLNPVYQTPN